MEKEIDSEQIYTANEIGKMYANLSLKEKNEVLYKALHCMETGGRKSRFACISMAIGYREVSLNKFKKI